VIAAASTPEKREFARAHGADADIDYTRTDWRDAFKELTGGHGADVIFDPVGGEISVQAFRSIAWRGRHLVVGFAAGAIPALPFNLPLLKGGALLGVDLAQIPTREPEVQQRLMSELMGWLAEGKLKPAVGRVFALEDFREAFRTMQTRAALGKMVIRMSK
jgi:NADPH2:quinone reductase